MSGMNLLEMIMSAQGGASAQQAGAQLGLSQEQSQGAIAALLPAISSALKQNTANPEGLAGLLGALQKGQHDQYLDNPQAVAQPQAVSEGNAILGHLFGSKDVSRAVAGHAAQQTGMDASILKKMLPMVAAMAMGSLSKQTRQPSMAQGLAGLALNQVMGGGQKGGLLGGILGSVLGGGQKRQMQQQRQQHQQGLGMLGNLLDADGNGSVMDDVLKMAMKGMMK
jgi:hypothetical protein